LLNNINRDSRSTYPSSFYSQRERGREGERLEKKGKESKLERQGKKVRGLFSATNTNN
jgi:hypothetical protein